MSGIETEPTLYPNSDSKDHHEDPNKHAPPKEYKVVSLGEDPEYKRIFDELSKAWVSKAGEEQFSGAHQDYMYGNPKNPEARTLEQDARAEFERQYPEQFATYEEHERVRAYANINEDPAYISVQEQITARTNTDSQVTNAQKTGKNWRGTWDRVNTRENIHGMNAFVREYPEKSEAYAATWHAFIAEHPEIATMDSAQWDVWCSKNTSGYTMNIYRDMARTVDHVKTRKKIDQQQATLTQTTQELATLREDIGIPAPDSTDAIDTPLEQDTRALNELQLEDIISDIQVNIPPEIASADREALMAMKELLADLPYLSGNDASEILDYDGEDEGMMMVDANAIVGSVSSAFTNWSTEYDGRQGRIVDVAEKIMEGTPEAINGVFHITDPKGGIQLKKLSGPDGAIFFVEDGTHRVAGSKLAQIQEVPAQVENMTELAEIRTADSVLKSEWEKRIQRGLIKGNINETVSTSGQRNFSLHIDSQVLPWMSLPRTKFFKMTKFYAERYPDSLDNLQSLNTDTPIPKEALLDEVAMNYYLADDWNNYKPTNKAVQST